MSFSALGKVRADCGFTSDTRRSREEKKIVEKKKYEKTDSEKEENTSLDRSGRI